MTSSSLSPRSSLLVIIRWYGRLVAASPTVPTQTSRSSRAFVTCSAFAELASRFAVMMIAIEELPKGELYGRNFWFNTSPTGGSGNRLLRRFLSISLGRDEAGGDCLQRGPLHRGGGGAIVLQVSILSTRSCLPWDCLLGWQFLGRQYIKGVPKKWLPEFSRMTGHLLVDYLSNHYFSHQARVNIERIMIWPSADRSSLKIQKYTFFGTPYCIFTNCSHGNLLPSVMRCTWRPEAARNFLRRRVSLDSWREGRSLISSSLTCKVGGILSTVSDWQDGIPQVTRTRSCLDTSRPRTWCTSSSSSQTTGTLRAFGWTVGKSRIHWVQSSHSDRNLKMIHFLWKKTTTGHFSWKIKIPIFSFIGTKQIWAFSIETFLVFQGIHEYIVKSK